MFFFPVWNLLLRCFPQRDARDAESIARRLSLVLEDVPPFQWTAADSKPAVAECSICLVDFAPGDECRKLACSHYFHRECIERWLDQRLRCPLCNSAPTTPVRKETRQQPASPASVVLI